MQVLSILLTLSKNRIRITTPIQTKPNMVNKLLSLFSIKKLKNVCNTMARTRPAPVTSHFLTESSQNAYAIKIPTIPEAVR